MGAMARQGPHHVAQKSTRTGLSDFKTSWSKFASVTSTIPLPACDGVDLVVLVSVPAISISPRCNVALFGGRSMFRKQRAVVAGTRDDLLIRTMNACPNR